MALATKPSSSVQPVSDNRGQAKKWVFLFSEVELAEKAVGGKWDAVRALLGGKGAGLADMTRAGVPVLLASLSLLRPATPTRIARNSQRTCGIKS